MIDAAEEEDFKEAILAYSFLLNNKDGLTAEALDEKIEYWFKVKYQCELDFEIVDALSKLERMELVELNNNVYQAIALDEAKIILDTHWDNIFNYA